MPRRSKEFFVWKLSLCVTVLSVLPLGAALDECPKGWHFYEEGQQCFLLDPAPPLSWEKARAMCKSYGGDLTTIPDSKTNTFVKDLMKSSCENYWIGLHDNLTENVFQWLDQDGETHFTYWAPDEPNNLGDEDCVYISGLNESQWNDAVCTAQLGFSCQRAAKTIDSAPTPVSELIEECPEGWHFYPDGEQCFLFDPLSPLSWEKARARCKSYGGDLIVISDSNTNMFVKDLVNSSSTDYWIGLHYSLEGNVFRWLSNVSETHFTYWAPDEPSNLDGEDCVYLSAENENRWINAVCKTQIGFSCQRTAYTNYTDPTPEPLKECPEGWHFYKEREKCFLLDPLSRLSWEAARTRCRSYGGDLTSIPDSKTNTFVKGLINITSTDYWIGLQDSVEENVFHWLDDIREINFTFWGPDEPNNEGNEDCVCIAGKMGKRWNDAVCTLEIGFSCQRDAYTKYTDATPEPIEGGILFTSPSVQTTNELTTTQKPTTPKPSKITYRVVTNTGCRSGGGTDATVHIVFAGKLDWTRKMYLYSYGDRFEQGDTDTFYLKAPDVGPLTSIYIGHNDAGSGAGWYLETVTVSRYPHPDDAICLLETSLETKGNLRKQTDEEAICDNYLNVNPGSHQFTKLLNDYQVYEESVFRCRRWIATDEADGRLQVQLGVSDRRISLERKR